MALPQPQRDIIAGYVQVALNAAAQLSHSSTAVDTLAPLRLLEQAIAGAGHQQRLTDSVNLSTTQILSFRTAAQKQGFLNNLPTAASDEERAANATTSTLWAQRSSSRPSLVLICSEYGAVGGSGGALTGEWHMVLHVSIPAVGGAANAAPTRFIYSTEVVGAQTDPEEFRFAHIAGHRNVCGGSGSYFGADGRDTTAFRDQRAFVLTAATSARQGRALSAAQQACVQASVRAAIAIVRHLVERDPGVPVTPATVHGLVEAQWQQMGILSPWQPNLQQYRIVR